MKFSPAKATIHLIALLILGWGMPKPVQAQEASPDEFVLRTGQDERRLDGIIRSINPERGSFTLDATSVSYPSGRPNPRDIPLTVVVQTHSDTFLHVRGDTSPDVEFTDAHVGDSAVVIATFAKTEQKWLAVEVALWTREEKGRYILEGKKKPFPLPAGLVASWKWEDSATDTSGKYIGSQQNGATFVPGLIGKALKFDGVDDRFAVADTPAFALTRSLSIEGWVFITPPLATRFSTLLIRCDTKGRIDPYMLYVKLDGTLSFRVMSEKKTTIVNAPLPAQKWVHIAATLDDATGVMRLYINGVMASESQTDVRAYGPLVAEDGAALGIGNYPARPAAKANYPFRGLIDEISLYNRALNAPEIQGIYKAGSAGKAFPPAPAPPNPTP